MTRLQLFACALGLTTMVNTSASAAGFLKLGASDKSSGITALGTAPVKKKKELNLGTLRTREARLPNGVLSLSDRMRLRAKQAISRQNAVSKARRSSQSDSRANEGNDNVSNSSGGNIVMQ